LPDISRIETNLISRATEISFEDRFQVREKRRKRGSERGSFLFLVGLIPFESIIFLGDGTPENKKNRETDKLCVPPLIISLKLKNHIVM